MNIILITKGLIPLLESSKNFLSREDIELFSVSSGTELVNTHRAENANLIITELDLPVIKGNIACAMIRNDDTIKKVSIVIVCDNEKSAIARCQASGANTYLRKPINTIELRQTIKKYLYVAERKDIRVTLDAHVRRNSPSNKSFSAYSKDISTSGILFETDELLKKGERVKCSFTIEKYPINIIGEVVRLGKRFSHKYSYGMQFLEGNTESRHNIQRFIDNSVKHI